MTYLLLIAIFGAASLALLLAARRRLAPRSVRAMLVAFLALSALTIVFDSLMIAADLFSYGPGTTGIRLWLAPIEDLAYPAVALLVGVAVWSLVPARRRADAGAAADPREDA